MKQETAFANILEEIRHLAREQENRIDRIQVEEAFGRIGITGERLEPVYDYLRAKNIGIDQQAKIVLNSRDQDYLADYLGELQKIEELREGEKRALSMAAMTGDEEAKRRLLQSFLRQTTDIARIYSGQGVLLEDLIGEGNVALAAGIDLLGCLEDPNEVEGFLAGLVMEAMEKAIEQQELAKRADQMVAQRINRVSILADELSGHLRRKVTVEELAKETDLCEEEIWEAIRLSGNRIEQIHWKEW